MVTSLKQKLEKSQQELVDLTQNQVQGQITPEKRKEIETNAHEIQALQQ
jgi:hypothetical protein